MCTSCAMMASRVTPPAEDEGVEVDGVEKAGGVDFSDRVHLGLSWASFCLTVAASMALITVK